MSRHPKPSKPRHRALAHTAPAHATVERAVGGDAMIVHVSGVVDEHFGGFGEASELGAVKALVIHVAGMTRMTSFGVRQWLKAMDALPKTLTDVYLLGCPTFFVDQLNMVLNFGGVSKTLTVLAPYACAACGVESAELIDLIAERANLAKGGSLEKECARCGGKLELDETPESYFGFAAQYAATSLQPAAAALLAAHGLYTSSDSTAEKPPRIIKLVHGSVTYFRIIGSIGSTFRARPVLVGAEGEVVIDLAEVARFHGSGPKEWRRLLKSLAGQVPSVTLVDVNESFLTTSGDTLMLARNIAVLSVLVPYVCVDCQRTSQESVAVTWPLQFTAHVCTTCGGVTAGALPAESLVPLQKASTTAPPASAKVIDQRDEILSRALTDASVAQAGEMASAAVAIDDTILGKYKIVRRLSAGGMAEVFVAKQLGIGGFEKLVALKRIQRELLATRHQAIELFLNEAKIAGRLTHPNIVQVLDVGEVGGALYLAMEYVHGKDLRDIIRKLQQTRTTMPLGEACYIVREVAQALHHAYWSTDMSGKQLAVVHRDVSPHNVILSYDGMVKLLDFGVAISAVTEHEEKMIVGKWRYMSPEATTHQPIDHRSDLFSLGVILYLLCSGQMPFAGKDSKDVVRKIRAGQYKPLQDRVPVPERLAVLVNRLLSPDPDDRPQTGQEVATELTELARQYGIESSGARVASIVAQLFPSEDGAPAPEGDRDLVRVVLDDSAAKDRATASLTPGGNTMSSSTSQSVSHSSRAFAPADVSETYEWREPSPPAPPPPAPPPAPAARTSSPKIERTSSPKIERTSSPKIERTSSPKIERTSSPKIERTSSPSLVRKSSPSLARTSGPLATRTTGGTRVTSHPAYAGTDWVRRAIVAVVLLALAAAAYLLVRPS